MQLIDGKPVAAIAAQPEQQREAGVPPLWNSYISVDSADAVAERASELGATVHAPPFDVMSVGRMAVIQDPQGAFFMPWEPRDHFGAALVNQPGALVWNELQSPDLDASAAFYSELFGWQMEDARGMRGALPDDQERRCEQRRHPRADAAVAAELARVLRRRGRRAGARAG